MVQERQIRSFIAIEIPMELKTALGSFRSEMISASSSFVKWVSPGSIHITLKFLGNISPDRVEKITEAIGQACEGMDSFNLESDELGGFPNLGQPRVLWVGIHGEIEKIKLLQSRIDGHLVDLGFKREEREFTPHITLARIRDKAGSLDRRKLGELVTRRTFDFRCKIRVDGVNLMRSQLLPGGAVYTCLSVVKLNKDKKNIS